MHIHFSKEKFLSLSESSQHKKCCEILESLLDHLDDQKMKDQLINQYELICMWRSWIPLKSLRPEYIADRFHFHLEQSPLGIQEHNLLYQVKTKDGVQEELPFLSHSIYLNKIRSAHNIGSIIRSNEALRVGELVFSENMATPNHPQVQKTAMGSIEYTPWRVAPPFEDCPRPLIAIETTTHARSLFDFTFPETPFTLLLGNEEYGIDPELLKLADHVIEIPMYGYKNSINVANAFAVCAFEIRKQSQNKKSKATPIQSLY